MDVAISNISLGFTTSPVKATNECELERERELDQICDATS